MDTTKAADKQDSAMRLSILYEPSHDEGLGHAQKMDAEALMV
jgi:hypothetical protein